MARILQHRLADFAAAECASDLVAGNPSIVLANPEERMVIKLGMDFQIILIANHNKVPKLPSGRVNWAEVTRLQILSIEEIAHD